MRAKMDVRMCKNTETTEPKAITGGRKGGEGGWGVGGGNLYLRATVNVTKRREIGVSSPGLPADIRGTLEKRYGRQLQCGRKRGLRVKR